MNIRWNDTSKWFEKDTSAGSDYTGPFVALAMILDGVEFGNGQGAGTAYHAYVSGSNVMRFNVATGKSYAFRINNVDKFTISAGGDIVAGGGETINGLSLIIGQSGNPNYTKYDNTANSGKKWRVGSTGAVSVTSFDIYNETDGVTALTIDSTGKVGIGVSPAVKLDVNNQGVSGNIVRFAKGGGSGALVVIGSDAGGNEYISSSILNFYLVAYTVAGLPTGVLGDRAFVIDSLAPVFGAAVVGGGGVKVPVYYTGAAWFVG